MNSTLQLRTSYSTASRHADDDGFTLVELLVVIVVLGILIAIAVPTFLSEQNKANDASVKTELSTAYKVSAADAVDQGGNFSDPKTLAGVINKSEPELDAAILDGVDDAARDTVGIVKSSGSDLLLAELSKSGDICTLEVDDHRTDGPTCAAPTQDSGGSPDPGDNGKGTDADDFDVDADLVWTAVDAGNGNVAELHVADADDTDNQIVASGGDTSSYSPGFVSDGKLYGVTSDGGLVSINSNGKARAVATSSAYCDGRGLISSGPYGATTYVAAAGPGQMDATCMVSSGPSGSSYDIVRMNVDGSDVTVLASITGFFSAPEISANQTTVAYLLTPGYNVFEVPQAGGASKQITSSGDVQNIALSPTGTLAVQRITAGLVDIWTTSNGSPYERLTNDAAQKGEMQFSQDGKTLAYTEFNPFNSMRANIFTVPSSGGASTAISQAKGASSTGVLWLR